MYLKADRAKEIWTTVASARWDNHEDEGFRFTQRGTGSFPALKGLEASIDFHNEIGPERVYERIKFLGFRLRTGLRANPKVKIFSPEDENLCAGITVYNILGMTGAQLQEEYWTRAKMRPRSSGPEFGVRHCTHIFNSVSEIDRALEIVEQLSKG
jgi:isopenicillin-N epimerase